MVAGSHLSIEYYIDLVFSHIGVILTQRSSEKCIVGQDLVLCALGLEISVVIHALAFLETFGYLTVLHLA